MNSKYYEIASILSLIGIVTFMASSLVFSSTVTVSATVSASSVTCNTNPSSVTFGALDTASVKAATTNASTSLSCNNGLGCTLNISDSNAGLATTSPAYTIPSTSGTLSAGAEGYGVQSSSTAEGTGGTLGVSASYLVTGNTVGRLNTTSTLLASSTASVSNRSVLVAHLAAISTLTPAGSYSDTITYSCTGN